MTILKVQQLTIAHEKTIVQSFDWQVNAGEKWAVLGANGAGKSSILHGLLGVEAFALARVYLKHHLLATLTAAQQARLRVWVPQRYDEAFSVTVRAALMSVAGQINDVQMQNILTQFGLLDVQNAWVHLLSGGERQRLSWAIAAARYTADTKIWLLDEPFAAQDLAWQSRLLKYISDLPCAVVAALHDLNQVAQFATHVAVLVPTDDGCVFRAGTYDEMMQADVLNQVYQTRLHKSMDASGDKNWWHVL